MPIGAGTDHLNRHASALQLVNQPVAGNAAFLGAREDNDVASTPRLTAILVSGAPERRPQVRTFHAFGGSAELSRQRIGATGEQWRLRIPRRRRLPISGLDVRQQTP